MVVERSTGLPLSFIATAARARPGPMAAATSVPDTGASNWRTEPSGSVMAGMGQRSCRVERRCLWRTRGGAATLRCRGPGFDVIEARATTGALIDRNFPDHPVPIMIGAAQVVLTLGAGDQKDTNGRSGLHHDIRPAIRQQALVAHRRRAEKRR